MMTDSEQPQTESRRPPKRLLLGLAASAAVLVVAAAWWLGLLTPEPEAVSLEAAVETVEEPSVEPSVESGETPADAEEDVAETANDEATTIAGTWTVVEQEATFAGYRADGTTGEAVGRTPGVTGTLEATAEEITAVSITVDMTQLTSDSSLRDEHLGDEGIEYNTYPESNFVLTEPIQIGDVPNDGESVAFEAVGDLTVRDVTLPVVVNLEGALVGEQLVVVGSTDIDLDDFGASVSSTTTAVMEFSLIFTQ